MVSLAVIPPPHPKTLVRPLVAGRDGAAEIPAAEDGSRQAALLAGKANRWPAECRRESWTDSDCLSVRSPASPVFPWILAAAQNPVSLELGRWNRLRRGTGIG